jgi:hypothetical protein
MYVLIHYPSYDNVGLTSLVLATLSPLIFENVAYWNILFECTIREA